MQPAFSERYVITVEANDGARLWVGDQQMFDNFDEVRCVIRYIHVLAGPFVGASQAYSLS